MHRILILSVLLFVLSCAQPEQVIIHHQVSGLGKTNSYLLYGERSKEAALIDVGGSIDTLETIINIENLDLKYILITHAHQDHVYGIPYIREKYPTVKIGLSREEYEDVDMYRRWEDTLDSALVVGMKQAPPEVQDLYNFDYHTLEEPILFLEDDQVFILGDLKIRTFISPGHSRGSLCFLVGNVLFTGDVLFHRSVGRTDLFKSGGPNEIETSVRRLYNLLPDETIVYPGHGAFTDIGSEKLENKKVRVETP